MVKYPSEILTHLSPTDRHNDHYRYSVQDIMICTGTLVLLFSLFLNERCGVYSWIPSASQVLLSKRSTSMTECSIVKRQVSSTNPDHDRTTPLQMARNIRSNVLLSNSERSVQFPATRRESFNHLLTKSGGILSALTVLTSTMNPTPAAAATASSSSVITPEEIKRIQVGYEQITYLLDHFEEETTVCRENGGECKRDANAIRKVLGLRSTTDPLFQIEKVFAKFKNLSLDDDVDVDIEALYDAAEDWNSSISMSNSMAFISQFGEYNPGGGKDEVLKYLLESKKQVLFAKDALQTIMVNLKIPLSKD